MNNNQSKKKPYNKEEKVLTMLDLKNSPLSDKIKKSIGIVDGFDMGLYGDDCWNFSLLDHVANIQRCRKMFKFNAKDPLFNLMFSDDAFKQKYSLEEASRDILWLRMHEGCSSFTLKSEFRAWQIFKRWWYACFYGVDFSDWLKSPTGLDNYVKFCRLDVDGKVNKSYVSPSVHRERVQPIFYLYTYRVRIKYGLSKPPFQGMNSTSLVGYRIEYNQTAWIDEKIWLSLIQQAWILLDELAPAIEFFVDYWTNAKSRFSILPTRDGNAPSKSLIELRRVNFLESHGYYSYKDLNEKVQLFEGASIVLILALTGMRQSELSGLDSTCFISKQSEIPSLIDNICYLRGVTYKYSHLSEGESHEWLVPARIEKVISLVNRLNDHRRQKALRLLESDYFRLQKTNIWIDGIKSSSSLFLTSTYISNRMNVRLTSITIIRRIDLFVEYCAKILKWQKTPLIKPHMFRRTFARFVALSPLGTIEALRDQFGHRTGDVTAYYMQSEDSEMAEIILEDQSLFQKQLIAMQLESPELKVGTLGEKISLEQRLPRTIKISKNLKSLRRQFGSGMEIQLNAHSVSVRPVDQGACSNNCRLNRIKCISCENCVISIEQLPFWEDQLRIMEACKKEGIVQGLDEVQTLVNKLRNLSKNRDEQHE
ncbi:hypothetical protein [uncultured Tolumonas sp.]|uniref:hypothetical protein n=1 Tax=uncultured Tolumonas sp. TaxID=263765 RepID=UPI00292DD37B|nr:hypothetical protein [uncultured Tolumonas sp.]